MLPLDIFQKVKYQPVDIRRILCHPDRKIKKKEPVSTAKNAGGIHNNIRNCQPGLTRIPNCPMQ